MLSNSFLLVATAQMESEVQQTPGRAAGARAREGAGEVTAQRTRQGPSPRECRAGAACPTLTFLAPLTEKIPEVAPEREEAPSTHVWATTSAHGIPTGLRSARQQGQEGEAGSGGARLARKAPHASDLHPHHRKSAEDQRAHSRLETLEPQLEKHGMVTPHIIKAL